MQALKADGASHYNLVFSSLKSNPVSKYRLFGNQNFDLYNIYDAQGNVDFGSRAVTTTSTITGSQVSAGVTGLPQPPFPLIFPGCVALHLACRSVTGCLQPSGLPAYALHGMH